MTLTAAPRPAQGCCPAAWTRQTTDGRPAGLGDLAARRGRRQPGVARRGPDVDWNLDQLAKSLPEQGDYRPAESFPPSMPGIWLHKAKSGLTVETVGIEPTSAIACEWLLRAYPAL